MIFVDAIVYISSLGVRRINKKKQMLQKECAY